MNVVAHRGGPSSSRCRAPPSTGPSTRKQLDAMVDAGLAGIARLMEAQQRALGG